MARNLRLDNLFIYVIANGYGAYGEVDVARLRHRLAVWLSPLRADIYQPVMQFKWLEGLAGHYLTLTTAQYEEAMA